MTSSPMKNTFLHNILQGCETIEKDKLTSLLYKLGKEMLDLKLRVKYVIEETCVNFTGLAQDHCQLLQKAELLTREIDDLSNKVTNHTTRSLKDSTKELQELSASMQEVSMMSAIVNQLVEFDVAFQLMTKLRDKKNYSEIAVVLIRIRSMLEEQADKNNDLEIYGALAKEYSLQSDIFLDELSVIWRECIKFEDQLDENTPHLQHSTLQIDTSRSKETSQIFLALNSLEHLTLHFKRFAEWVLKSMLTPVIVHSACATTQKNGNYTSICVEMKPCALKHSHKGVFENLLTIFHFIHYHMGVNVEDGVTLLNKLGVAIDKEFCSLLVEYCLSATIPSHSSELGGYESVVADTSDFQSQLIEIGFLDKNDQPLLDYIANVEYLCANKTCRTLLEKSREIMKKDLHDMMEIEGKTEELMVKEEDSGLAESEDIASIKPEISLSDSTFKFPKCQISKSALELLNLINQIMVDCAASTDTCAIRLFYTARNIIELYCAVVPTYHQKFLETIPQHVALFHNNCMYLSHCLLTLGDKHRNILPQVLQAHVVTFVDQVSELRTLGTSVFLKHMQTQRNQILDIIRNCGLATLGESSNLTSGTEKALRQCMRQLELLQSVWQPVLPDYVYCKAIGCLVNSFVDELITRVVTVEDIPADTATQLVEMFKLVSSRIPKVFQEPKEIHRHVKKWQMFLELVLILGASLREISERWANSKGPIAHLFQPEQVKQLIRALFQNTERRSAVLASIK